ncbi:MAG TPA: ABC transporter permease, partial [Blastocatellia bacterium]|nr:ABC transporter permease [Blastocatellia bacterium]
MFDMFRKIFNGATNLARKDTVERDMDQEVRFHLEMEIQQNIRRGMSPSEARLVALRNFGGVEQVKEQCRDEKGGRLVEALLQDVRYGARVLIKNPAFTLVALVTLALGIGANTAIFSVIYGVLMRPLPYQDGSSLVVLHQLATRAAADNQNLAFSVKEIADYREQSQTLDGVAEHHTMSFILLGREEPERVSTAVVSANFFELLGVKPLLGRTFLPEDDQKGADAVLVLSHKYWRENHGGDPNIVGRVFTLNDRPHTVIGVLPPIPQYPVESDVYMPTVACPTRSSDRVIANRNFRMMSVFARLKPGVTADQAKTDLSMIASNLRKEYPDSYPDSRGYDATAALLKEELTQNG